MPRFTEVNGVYFTEDAVELVVIGDVSVRAPTQNTSLLEVKKTAAARVVEMGGNGLMDYRYTQKADSTLKDYFWIKWDSERITVTGRAVRFERDPRDGED